jgi:hypothetical protein
MTFIPELTKALTQIAQALYDLEPETAARISRFAINVGKTPQGVRFPESKTPDDGILDMSRFETDKFSYLTRKRLENFITNYYSAASTSNSELALVPVRYPKLLVLHEELQLIEYIKTIERLYSHIYGLRTDSRWLFDNGITTPEKLLPLLSPPEKISFHYYEEYSRNITAKEYVEFRERIRFFLDDFDLIGDVKGNNSDPVPSFELTISGDSPAGIATIFEILESNNHFIVNLQTFTHSNLREDLVRIGSTVRLLITNYFPPEWFDPNYYPVLIPRNSNQYKALY